MIFIDIWTKQGRAHLKKLQSLRQQERINHIAKVGTRKEQRKQKREQRQRKELCKAEYGDHNWVWDDNYRKCTRCDKSRYVSPLPY